MGRSKVTTIRQPDDLTCGPAALKHALTILGKRKSLDTLIELCQTNRNGTSTQKMINAVNKLGYSAMVVEGATLHHLQSALRYRPNQNRAVLVSYLYDLDEKERPHPESGHWAVVSSFAASKSRIVLLDSASGRKKSYSWTEFRDRWTDYDLRRRKIGKSGNHFKLVKRWQSQLLLVIAKEETTLPRFRISTARIFPAAHA